MKNPIEQLKVITTEEKTFADKNGEVVKYYQVQAMSHGYGIFIFNEYGDEPKPDTIYNMYLEHDSRMKPKVVCKKAE